MTPYEELRVYGQFDEAGYHLLFELTRQELRAFPGIQPAGGGDDPIRDVAGEFLVERGRGVATMLLAEARPVVGESPQVPGHAGGCGTAAGS